MRRNTQEGTTNAIPLEKDKERSINKQRPFVHTKSARQERMELDEREARISEKRVNFKEGD
jgi:hypothetical protein